MASLFSSRPEVKNQRSGDEPKARKICPMEQNTTGEPAPLLEAPFDLCRTQNLGASGTSNYLSSNKGRTAGEVCACVFNR